MNIAYFDCFSGICGDMILGALFDLGLDESFFKKEIDKLDISGYDLAISSVKRNNITVKDVMISIIE